MQWIGALALLGCSALVAAVTPSDAVAQAPFRTELIPGGQVDGRTISGELLDVRLAEEITDGVWSAEGNWLILDLEVEARKRDETLWYARLERADGVQFRSSERPASLRDQGLSAGLPVRGSLVFELSDQTLGQKVRVDIGTVVADPRADSLLSLEIDLAELTPVQEAQLLPTEPVEQGSD